MVNEEQLRARLAQMDDAALSEMVRKIGAALGLGGFQTKMMAANPSAVRKKLDAADTGKISELLASLDSATLTALLGTIQEKK